MVDFTYTELFAAVKELLPTRTFAVEAVAWQSGDSAQPVEYRMTWRIWHAGLSKHFEAPSARGAFEALEAYLGVSEEKVFQAIDAVGVCEAG